MEPTNIDRVKQALDLALWVMGAAIAMVALMGVTIGYFLGGRSGAWAGLAGGGVCLVMAALTLAANRWALHHMDFLFAIIMGAFVVKLVVLIGAVTWAKSAQMGYPKVFGAVVLAGVLATMVAESLALSRSVRGAVDPKPLQ